MLNYGKELDDELMYMETLEDIRDKSKSHPDVIRRDSHYEIRDPIKQRQS